MNKTSIWIAEIAELLKSFKMIANLNQFPKRRQSTFYFLRRRLRGSVFLELR